MRKNKEHKHKAYFRLIQVYITIVWKERTEIIKIFKGGSRGVSKGDPHGEEEWVKANTRYIYIQKSQSKITKVKRSRSYNQENQSNIGIRGKWSIIKSLQDVPKIH